jgi:uncharacterized cysteine cluster protein YcgN (CxxCxxCC family)
MSRNQQPFWMTKTLEQMNPEEWESLCDGCAQCCLHKIQDDETEEIYTTHVACRLLDLQTCQCKNYPKRHKRVPSCVLLTPAMVRQISWLPETCGYRRVAEGRDLPDWHPLKTGDPESVHRAGASVRDRAISERDIDMNSLEDYIVAGEGFNAEVKERTKEHKEQE